MMDNEFAKYVDECDGFFINESGFSYIRPMDGETHD